MSSASIQGGSHPSGATRAIRTTNLHVAYDSNVVLHGVDFDVPLGQCMAITGSNGSGKSTLVKALLGAAPVTLGEIELFGKTRRSHEIPWEKIGYVPQRASTPSGVPSSALEVVRSGTLGPRQWWHYHGSKKASLRALHTVGLVHRRKQPFQTLSGGQQQRVLIARALVRNPQLLLMDEPLAGIDRHSQTKLADIIGELKAEGRTIVLVLHELGPLEPHLDRIVNLSAGHIDFDGEPTDAPAYHSEPHCHPNEPHDPSRISRSFSGGLDD
ncbi:MAG: metal ABC transporter ATP-binding protein [Actinomycetaceae bacterium]|nr:metal ABC transporter ATP-binding protein [Actinomycetaceae bacterium]